MGPDRELPVTTVPGETAAVEPDATPAADLTSAPEAAAEVGELSPSRWASTPGLVAQGPQWRSAVSFPCSWPWWSVAVTFQIITPEHSFLRPSNLVYIFGLSTVYMVLAIAETVVLLLAEIDLSVGAVALIGGVIAFKLAQSWPWWAAILAALVSCGVFGALQGMLTARLKIPSFIVTLAGFLLFSGILIVVLGGADGSVNLDTSKFNQKVIYDLVQG